MLHIRDETIFRDLNRVGLYVFSNVFSSLHNILWSRLSHDIDDRFTFLFSFYVVYRFLSRSKSKVTVDKLHMKTLHSSSTENTKM